MSCPLKIWTGVISRSEVDAEWSRATVERRAEVDGIEVNGGALTSRVLSGMDRHKQTSTDMNPPVRCVRCY